MVKFPDICAESLIVPVNWTVSPDSGKVKVMLVPDTVPVRPSAPGELVEGKVAVPVTWLPLCCRSIVPDRLVPLPAMDRFHEPATLVPLLPCVSKKYAPMPPPTTASATITITAMSVGFMPDLLGGWGG